MNRNELIAELKLIATRVEGLIGQLEDAPDTVDSLVQRCQTGVEKCKESGKMSENQVVFYKNDIEAAKVNKDVVYLQSTLKHLLKIFKGEVI